MRKIVVAESLTVDGFVDAEKFIPYNSVERNKYMQETVFAADSLLVGRMTYELLAPAWSSQNQGLANKMNGMPKYVIALKPLKAQWNDTTTINQNVEEEIAKLKQQDGQDILILGSATLVQSLMQADLIDEYKLLVHPIVAGSGKRFFKNKSDTKALQLAETKTIDSGMVLLCYRPDKKA